MRTTLFSAIALVLLAACSNGGQSSTPATTTGPDADQPMNNEPKQGDGTPAKDLQKPMATTLSEADSEALGILSAINQHEIAAGQQAQGRELPPKVKAYADMMVKDHTDNDAQIQKMGPPGESALATAQKTKGEAELAALGAHKDDYAQAYVDAMVSGHTEALKTLDEKLLPQSQAAAVKEHLQNTRTAVSQHLEQAKSLQRSLASP